MTCVMQQLQLQTFYVLVLLCIFSNSAELTFDLSHSKQECFYEVFKAGERAQLNFRVISGGNYDIDARLLEPDNDIVYEANKLQHGGHVFSVTNPGVYTACFSNEFSAFSNKQVFFVLRSGHEAPPFTDAPPGEADGPDTQLLTSLQDVGASLAAVSDFQTHLRLGEARDRLAAEATAWSVAAWAVFETLVIVGVGIGQVLFVRSLFSARPSGRLTAST